MLNFYEETQRKYALFTVSLHEKIQSKNVTQKRKSAYDKNNNHYNKNSFTDLEKV